MGRDKSFAWALLAILNGSLVLLCFDSLSLSISLSLPLLPFVGVNITHNKVDALVLKGMIPVMTRRSCVWVIPTI